MARRKLDRLEAELRAGPKSLYVLPNFQNPSGVTLSLERRRRLVELANHYGTPIVEDDPLQDPRPRAADRVGGGPGAGDHPPRPDEAGLRPAHRLNFSSCDPATIEEGIRRLGRIVVSRMGLPAAVAVALFS